MRRLVGVIRAFIIILVFILCVSFVSCGGKSSARDMLSDFCNLYGASGVIYSPEVREGEDGYITPRLFSDIYLFYGAPPENYAVMLNSRTDISAECGVFLVDNGAELSMIEEMCRERISAIGADGRGVIIRSGGTLFYSTFADTERVREIWYSIIRSHT